MARRLILLTLLSALLASPVLAQDAMGGDLDRGDDADESGEGEQAPGSAEPDSWERPPMEEEKPQQLKPVVLETKTLSDGLPWSVGLVIGYGMTTDNNNDFSVNPYSLGFGLRGGYTLGFGVYVGIYYSYLIGSSDTLGGGQTQLDVSANYMLTGGEVGYDAWFGPVIIRPSLQIGPAIALSEVQLSGSDTTISLSLAPGLTIVHPFDSFFLGGDARFNIVTGDGTSGFIFYLTGGYRFDTN